MIQFNRAVARREELTAKIRAKLADDPDKLAEFEELFDAAQYAYPLTEDHAFYIDQMGVVLFRRFVRAVGAALARNGCIAEGDDVFFLFDREVRDTMANGTDYKSLVQERKAELEACGKAQPPDILGTPPPPPQPGDFVDPFMDAVTSRLLGIKAPAEGEQDPNLIDGVAGSPGIYRGVARVVRSLEEAGDLEDGEVMVCEMTLPPWVPMFAIAGAVVSDVGGVMSHCAIVARRVQHPSRRRLGQRHHPDRDRSGLSPSTAPAATSGSTGASCKVRSQQRGSASRARRLRCASALAHLVAGSRYSAVLHRTLPASSRSSQDTPRHVLANVGRAHLMRRDDETGLDGERRVGSAGGAACRRRRPHRPRRSRERRVARSTNVVTPTWCAPRRSSPATSMLLRTSPTRRSSDCSTWDRSRSRTRRRLPEVDDRQPRAQRPSSPRRRRTPAGRRTWRWWPPPRTMPSAASVASTCSTRWGRAAAPATCLRT